MQEINHTSVPTLQSWHIFGNDQPRALISAKQVLQ